MYLNVSPAQIYQLLNVNKSEWVSLFPSQNKLYADWNNDKKEREKKKIITNVHLWFQTGQKNFRQKDSMIQTWLARNCFEQCCCCCTKINHYLKNQNSTKITRNILHWIQILTKEKKQNQVVFKTLKEKKQKNLAKIRQIKDQTIVGAI